MVTAFENMHSPIWYDKDIMRLIVGTLDDYLSDIQKRSSDYVFNKLTNQIIDRIMMMYIDSFKNKNAKFKMPTVCTRLRSDLDQLITFFSKFKNSKRVQVQLFNLGNVFNNNQNY